MHRILAGMLRLLIYPLVTHRMTYLPGMVLVRMARRLRKMYYKRDAVPDWHLVRLAGHIHMRVDRHSYMGGSIYWTGYHHLQELLYLGHRLKPGMTFIDVGANQGEFSLFAAFQLSKGNVISFEPVSKLRQGLLDNIQRNGFTHVVVHPFGLSDTSGSMPIYTSLETDIHFGRHEGLSTLYPSSSRNVLEETITLQVFDDVVHLPPGQDCFLKIDVEGAELYVLRGMRRLLEQCHPEILIEINEETFNQAGYTTKAILSFLSELGYSPYTIRRGYLVPVQASALSAWGNYIFKPGA